MFHARTPGDSAEFYLPRTHKANPAGLTITIIDRSLAQRRRQCRQNEEKMKSWQRFSETFSHPAAPPPPRVSHYEVQVASERARERERERERLSAPICTASTLSRVKKLPPVRSTHRNTFVAPATSPITYSRQTEEGKGKCECIYLAGTSSKMSRAQNAGKPHLRPTH